MMNKRKYLKCIISVIVSLILSLFITSDITSDLIISLIGGSADFEVSDFFNQVDAGKHMKTLNPSVLVIDTGNLEDRDSIATLIEQVAKYDPAVIGVDMIFKEPKEPISDSLLIDACLRNQHRLVMAASVYSNGTDEGTYIEKNILTDRLDPETFGAVNLIAKPGGIVRSFIARLKAGEVDVPTFASAIVDRMHADGSISRELNGDKIMKLRYSNDRFSSITPDKLQDTVLNLKGKIALLGTLDDPSDMHPTPVKPLYPGILIHAEIISSMLSGRYLSASGNLLDIVIASILAFLLCMVYVRLDNNNAQNLILRFILLTVVSLGIVIGCILYCKYNLYINIIMILLVIALSQFVLDIWYGTEVLVQWIRKRRLTRAATCLLAFSLISHFSVMAKSSYSVFDIKGVVTRIPSGHALLKGADPMDDEVLDLSKNQELTLSDKVSGRLYISSSHDRRTPDDIVQAAKSQSNSIIKRMFDEIIRNIGYKNDKRNALSGATQGMVVRDEGEELNANTEYLYSVLSGIISNHAKYLPHSDSIKMIQHFVNNNQVWWSISNTSSKPLFANILVLPAENEKPVFLFECTPDIPSLLVAPNSRLDLPSELFLYSRNRYILVASESQFDSMDIESFFRNSEEPLSLEEIPAKRFCIITDKISLETQ